MLIDTDILIEKEHLTPELRRQIVNLYDHTCTIVQENVWDLIDNNKIDEGIVKIKELRDIWGYDPILNQAQALINQIHILEEIH